MHQLRAYAVVVGLALGGFMFPMIAPATAPKDPATRERTEMPIPSSQRDVEFNSSSTASTGFAAIPNSQVTIDNGTSTRNVVITLSADARVSDSPDIFLLGFRVDGGLCTGAGPQRFARSTLLETRTAVHVLSIGSGVHTIQPCWAKFDDGDGLGSIDVIERTLIAEGRTR